MRLRQLACFVIVFALATMVAAQAPTDRAKPAVSLEQVRLTTSDGVPLDGVIYRPAGGPGPVGLMLVHGFGGNFYEAYFPAMGLAAAQHGMTVLALNMRDHGRGPKVSDFTDNQADIACGVEHLRSLGIKNIILLGQSMGTNRVLYYQAASADASVVATILVSGPGNLFQWNVWQFGEKKAEETVKEALRLQKQGRERELMVVDLGPLGKALYTPRYLLSLRGPEAKSDPYQNLGKVKNPVLILQGKADKLIQPDIAQRLHKAATNDSKVEAIYVEGANHGFTGHESALIERVLDWTDSLLR